MTPLRISGKNLGQLALANVCERCFWIRLKCQQRLPFQIFPGIFSSIDAYSKRVTNSYHEKHGRIPKWFDALGKLGTPIAVPHHSKFKIMDEPTGVLLTGAPDELVRRRDGSLIILDYKTARLSEHQDSLLPLYQVQLNSYAYIAERIGLGRVSKCALVYYEPMTALTAADVDGVVQEAGFAMRFNAKILPVEIALATIPTLLVRVREVHDMPVAPDGRAGCKDCGLLDGLVEVLQR